MRGGGILSIQVEPKLHGCEHKYISDALTLTVMGVFIFHEHMCSKDRLPNDFKTLRFRADF